MTARALAASVRAVLALLVSVPIGPDGQRPGPPPEKVAELIRSLRTADWRDWDCLEKFRLIWPSQKVRQYDGRWVEALRSPGGRLVLLVRVAIIDMPGLVSQRGDGLALVQHNCELLWSRRVRFVGRPAMADTGAVAVVESSDFMRRFRAHLIGRSGKTLCTTAKAGLVECHAFSHDGARYYFSVGPPLGKPWRPKLACIDLSGKELWRTRLNGLPESSYAVLRTSPGGTHVANLVRAHIDFPRGVVVLDDAGRVVMVGPSGQERKFAFMVGPSGREPKIAFEDGKLTIRDHRGTYAFGLPKGSPEERDAGRNVSPWSQPVGGLRSRIVVERPAYRQGEPIWARVELANVTDKPVPCDLRCIARDYRRACTRYSVVAPDGKPAPTIGHRIRPWRGREFIGRHSLPAARTIVLVPERLDLRFHMRKPGAYRVRWPSDGAGAWPALPATGAATIQVRPAPGGGLDGDLAGRLLRILPPCWTLLHTRLMADEVSPKGWLPGKGSAVTAWHDQDPQGSGSEARVSVAVLERPTKPDPEKEGARAEYLGKGKLGHVYLSRSRWCEGQWRHAVHDIAVAFEVADPPPKPNDPDWGRMVCRIMAACRGQAEKSRASRYFYQEAGLRPYKKGDVARVVCWCNLTRRITNGPMVKRDPGRPYFRVRLTVRPPGPPEPLAPYRGKPVRKALRADNTTGPAAKLLKRLGLEIQYLVDTDDAAFRDALTRIFDREIAKALTHKP